MLYLHANMHTAGQITEKIRLIVRTQQQADLYTEARHWGEIKTAVLLNRNGITLKVNIPGYKWALQSHYHKKNKSHHE
jgi:hypothetical protein